MLKKVINRAAADKADAASPLVPKLRSRIHGVSRLQKLAERTKNDEQNSMLLKELHQELRLLNEEISRYAW